MSDECKRCGNERVAHRPACSEDIWTDVAVRDEALRIAKAHIATLTTSLARVTAERDEARASLAGVEKVLSKIATANARDEGPHCGSWKDATRNIEAFARSALTPPPTKEAPSAQIDEDDPHNTPRRTP